MPRLSRKTTGGARGRRLALLTLPAVCAPLPLRASDGSAAAIFGYMENGLVVGLFLFSTAMLLLGLLIRLRQMNREIARTAAALQKSDTHIRLMGDSLPNVTIFRLVHETGETFRFHYLSKGYERALGIDRARVLEDARLAFDHLYEEDIPLLRQAYEEASETLQPVAIELRALDISGNLKWLQISAVPHRDDGLLIWDGFMQDVSAAKLAESALAEEKRNLQNLFETIEDFLLVCDMNGQIIHSNPALQYRLEYTADELDGMSISELYPEKLKTEICQVIAVMQSERTSTCGLPLRKKSGAAIQAEMNFFRGSWKHRDAIFGVARDIAGRKQVETALRESQQMLQLIMNTIPMSVFWKDKDSFYLGCNKSFVRECELHDVGDVIGKTPYDLFNPDIAADVVQRDQQVLAANQPILNALHSYARKGGTVGWRETSEIPLRNAAGRAVGVLGVWRDVTEHIQAEERLKRTLEDMERFNQLMRGRERRTLELKAEVNHLLGEIGRPSKYKTTSEDAT